jgi:outer membrane lipoprotein carrier protein
LLRNVLLAVSLAVASFVGVVDSARAEDTQTVIAAVESKYAGVTAMSGSFVQTTHSEMFGDETQSGSVLLKRPKMMFWDFGDKQFVTDGKTMWVYTQADNQVIRYDDIATGSSSADQLLTSLDQIDDLFLITTLPDDVGHSFDLAPKKQGGQVKTVHLEMSADLVVEKVVIVDALDNRTELQFTDMKLNVDVPDAKFTFVPPAGAEVISTGGK